MSSGAGSGELGFNLGEMIEQVADEIRNAQVESKIKRWINFAALRISAKGELPFFLVGPLEFQTTIGEPNYALYSVATHAVEYKDSQIRRVSAVWTESEAGGGVREIFPSTIKRIREYVPKWVTETGLVTHYLWLPKGPKTLPIGASGSFIYLPTIRLVKIPDSQFFVYCAGYLGPNKLEDNGEYSTFPAEWHPLIVQGAIIMGKKYEKAPDLADARQEYREMYRELMKGAFTRPDWIPRFVTQNTSEGLGRPPYPRLDPNHFASS